MTPVFDAIPQEMRDYPNWVLWRMEERDGRQTKIPYDPKCTFKRAKADCPKTWATFDQVVRAFEKGGFTGIGFQFSHTPFFGVDTDHKAYDGEIHPMAYNILERLDTYSELSPSRKGQHAIGRGNLPEWAMHKKRLAPDLEIEIYSEGRFFTITGELVLNGEVEDRQEALESLLKDLGMEKPVAAPRPAFTGQAAAFAGSDTQLWDRMFASTNGQRIRALADDDLSQHGGDHSAADFALCGHLAFWCNGDSARMDAMFRTTGLYRPKWDAKHSSEGLTYGELTIANVLERWNGEGYDPTRHAKPTTEREKWDDPAVLLRGRQHLASSHSHGNTVNSYSALWNGLVQVIVAGYYTTEGDTLTLTSQGMTELYAIAGGRPIDRRQQLIHLQSEGMVGKLKRQDTTHQRGAWLLDMPLNPADLPFWTVRGLLQPLRVSSHTGRRGQHAGELPTPSLVNNLCEREKLSVRKMPFWTLFSLSAAGRATTADIARQVGLSERAVREHLTAYPTLARFEGGFWVACLTAAEFKELHQQIEAPRVTERRQAIFTARRYYHEEKARLMEDSFRFRSARRHHGYARLYRQLTGVNAA